MNEREIVQADELSQAEDDRRNLWVSVDPAVGEDRTTATSWRAFVNTKTADGHRQTIGVFNLETASHGWAALQEIDAWLESRGYERLRHWELGTGRGFVAWIGLDVDALVEEWGGRD